MALKRLRYIKAESKMTGDEAQAWVKTNVLEVMSEPDRIALMRKLLRYKFTDDCENVYSRALRAQVCSTINVWSGCTASLCIPDPVANPDKVTGGDQMGVLLMARREELLKPKDANLADDSEDDDNCLPLVD